MEEDLNVFLNGRRPAGWLAYLALASPELGTAQPQLVFLIIVGLSYFYFLLWAVQKLRHPHPTARAQGVPHI